MLSLFPQILYLSPLGTTIIRVAAGIVFFWLAYYHATNRAELSKVRFVVAGKGSWIVWISVIVEAVIGIGLLVGYLTQLAALLGALLALKDIFWQKTYPQFFALSRAASFLLLAICLCLLVTGAGAFGFDLPL